MKILIDGRGIKRTGIGRYIENTLREILLVDSKNTYLLLIKPEDRKDIKLRANNLELVDADIEWFGVKEQTELLKLINSINPDLVHFTNFNFPVAYKGKFVITIHDLTLLHFKNYRSSLASKLFYIRFVSALKTASAPRPPRPCAIMYPARSAFVRAPFAQNIKLTAGLKCPPLIAPPSRITASRARAMSTG